MNIIADKPNADVRTPCLGKTSRMNRLQAITLTGGIDANEQKGDKGGHLWTE